MGNTRAGVLPKAKGLLTMLTSETLVSIGLPVRNGETTVATAIRSVLSQDHSRLELVISDNASDDGTEEVCRAFAALDSRVRYYRQPQNIGLINNFVQVLDLAQGTYFRWMGDDDWLATNYVSRCLETIENDQALILVTTQQAYIDSDGVVQTLRYDGEGLRSDRPLERITELLRVLNESYLLLDPLYGLMRRARVAEVPRVNMLYEDEVYAIRLALSGAFAYIPEVLSRRGAKPFSSRPELARKIGVPPWHAGAATLLFCRELLRAIAEADMSAGDRRRAKAAVARLYVGRHRQTVVHRARKLAAMAGGRLRGSSRVVGPYPKRGSQ
jgi:glycosyltransferase involved in cell wall biosynthesis